MPDEELETTDAGEEDCQPCKLSVGIGMYLNVCKTISTDGGKECDELYEKLAKEEITADDVFNLVREKVKDKPDQMEILAYIDSLVNGNEKAE